MTSRFHTMKFRTTIAGLAALAAFSTTGVASAAVPGTVGDTPMTVNPTSEASGGTTPALATPTTDPVVSETPTVAPPEPTHVAQVFRPDKMKKCSTLNAAYKELVAQAVQIEGNPDGLNPDDETGAVLDGEANKVREDAAKAGCGWAQ